MNLTKCSNGHFYDSDTYASCPHCGGGGASASNSTVAFSGVSSGGQSVGATVDLDSYLNDGPGQNPEPAAPDYDPDDSRTISIYQSGKMETKQMAPVVGWLVCISGKFYGQSFLLKSGRNFIGRGTGMDVCLAGENTVSRDRHATVIHEPRKNIFIAQPGESRELFYVNGNVVLSSVELKKNDVLQVGEVQLMLIPCCDEAFQWDSENE